MIVEKYIVIICWIVSITYWIVSSGRVKADEEVKKELSNHIWNIAGKITLIFLFLQGFEFPFSIPLLTLHIIPRIEILNFIAIVLLMIGLFTAIVARKRLSDNWSANVVFKKDQELVTSGIYKYIRHPIYTGVLLMAFSTLLFLGNISILILFLIMLLFLIFKLNEEESMMTKHFPREYEEYKKRTKALIPFVF